MASRGQETILLLDDESQTLKVAEAILAKKVLDP